MYISCFISSQVPLPRSWCIERERENICGGFCLSCMWAIKISRIANLRQVKGLAQRWLGGSKACQKAWQVSAS